jgi:putative inorganic carbon (hco3(-)) transporter
VAGLGVLLARAPLTLAALLVAGTFSVLLLLRWPTLGLYPLALTIPFGSLRQIRLGPANVGLSEAIVLSVMGAWMLHLLAYRRVGDALRRGRSPLTWALLAYLGCMALSLLPANQLDAAAKELAKWLALLFLYLFVRAELPRRQMPWLAAALLLGGALQSLLGIYQFLYRVGPPGFMLFGRYMRAYGSFMQPNPFAGYLGLLLPLAYAFVLGSAPSQRPLQSHSHRASTPSGTFGREKRGCSTKGHWRTFGRGAATIAALLMLTAMLMSWSRGALVGLVGGGILVLLALGRRYMMAIAAILLIAALLLPSVLPLLPAGALLRATDVVGYVGRDLSLIEITDDNFGVIQRVAHWQAAWQMFARRPWLGVGVGQFAIVYPEVALPRWQEPLGHAHNVYLHTLAEGGLIGLAGYLGVAIVALWSVWRAATSQRGTRRVLALGALGMLGHLLAHSVFDLLFVHGLYLLVGICLGMALDTEMWTADPPDLGIRSAS